MNITLGPDAQRLVEERMKRGAYATAEDVLLAGLAALERDESAGDFADGEWEQLLAEGEAGGESLDGEQVLAELRELRLRSTSKAG
jgi:Arc/MetJ-type ribon-helix-helix transcriptional regulator